MEGREEMREHVGSSLESIYIKRNVQKISKQKEQKKRVKLKCFLVVHF